MDKFLSTPNKNTQLDHSSRSLSCPNPPMNPHDYPHRLISQLVPGPAHISFTGVVVNLFAYNTSSSAPKAARGCCKLLLRDEYGEILVKLWHAEIQYSDRITLGSKLTVSTTHISATYSPGMSVEAIRALPASLMANIFPERDTGCTVSIRGTQPQNGKVNPLGIGSINLNGLMDLEAFVGGAAEDRFIEGVKLLVCVAAVGELTTITTRTSSTFQVLPIQILDASTLMIPQNTSLFRSSMLTQSLSSTPVELSLSASHLESSKSFISNRTILLLTAPKLHSQTQRKIKLTLRSQILLDPTNNEAITLRRWVQNLFPPINIPAIELQSLVDKIDQETQRKARTGNFIPGQGLLWKTKDSCRKQYTWALFMSQIQLEPGKAVKAYVSVLITQMNLVGLWHRHELFCMACFNCQNDVFSNSLFGTCTYCYSAGDQTSSEDERAKHDDDTEYMRETKDVQLRFNPMLLAGLSDETGGFSLPILTSSAPFKQYSSSSNHKGLRNYGGPAHHHYPRHNLLLTDAAVTSLTGLENCIFDRQVDEESSKDIEVRLREIERLLLWRRVTLVIGWTGNVEENKDGVGEGKKERVGKVVVLDVIT